MPEPTIDPVAVFFDRIADVADLFANSLDSAGFSMQEEAVDSLQQALACKKNDGEGYLDLVDRLENKLIEHTWGGGSREVLLQRVEIDQDYVQSLRQAMNLGHATTTALRAPSGKRL